MSVNWRRNPPEERTTLQSLRKKIITTQTIYRRRSGGQKAQKAGRRNGEPRRWKRLTNIVKRKIIWEVRKPLIPHEKEKTSIL